MPRFPRGHDLSVMAAPLDYTDVLCIIFYIFFKKKTEPVIILLVMWWRQWEQISNGVFVCVCASHSCNFVFDVYRHLHNKKRKRHHYMEGGWTLAGCQSENRDGCLTSSSSPSSCPSHSLVITLSSICSLRLHGFRSSSTVLEEHFMFNQPFVFHSQKGQRVGKRPAWGRSGVWHKKPAARVPNTHTWPCQGPAHLQHVHMGYSHRNICKAEGVLDLQISASTELIWILQSSERLQLT